MKFAVAGKAGRAIPNVCYARSVASIQSDINQQSPEQKLNFMTIKSLGRYFICALSPFVFSGCASIITESNQQLVFNSQPKSADVYVNDVKRGTTPCNILVPRQKPPPPIVLKKDGYEDTPVVFTTKWNPWVIGNILGGYFSTTSFIIDANSEKSIMYYPDMFLITLDPLAGTTEQEMKDVADQKQGNKIIRFVVVNYDELFLQASSGTGEHLDALGDLLEIPDDQRLAFGEKLKGMFIKYDDPPQVGRAVEMEFHKTKPQ